MTTDTLRSLGITVTRDPATWADGRSTWRNINGATIGRFTWAEGVAWAEGLLRGSLDTWQPDHRMN